MFSVSENTGFWTGFEKYLVCKVAIFKMSNWCTLPSVNCLLSSGLWRKHSKNSQNALETSLNHTTQDPSIAVACDRAVFSFASSDLGRLNPLSANSLRVALASGCLACHPIRDTVVHTMWRPEALIFAEPSAISGVSDHGVMGSVVIGPMDFNSGFRDNWKRCS